MSAERFGTLKETRALSVAVNSDCNQYLHDRLDLLEEQLATVNRLALANELPDAIITGSGLKITPLDATVPEAAQLLIDQTGMLLPHIKITELLMRIKDEGSAAGNLRRAVQTHEPRVR